MSDSKKVKKISVEDHQRRLDFYEFIRAQLGLFDAESDIVEAVRTKAPKKWGDEFELTTKLVEAVPLKKVKDDNESKIKTFNLAIYNIIRGMLYLGIAPNNIAGAINAMVPGLDISTVQIRSALVNELAKHEECEIESLKKNNGEKY